MYSLIKNDQARNHAHVRVMNKIQTLYDVVPLYTQLVLRNRANHIMLLPKAIYHHVISFLDWQYIAKLCVVCSIWNGSVTGWLWKHLPLVMSCFRSATYVFPQRLKDQEDNLIKMNHATGFSRLTDIVTTICKGPIPEYRNITTLIVGEHEWSKMHSYFSGISLVNIVLYVNVQTVYTGHPTCTHLTLKNKARIRNINLNLWPRLLELRIDDADIRDCVRLVPDQHPLRIIRLGGVNPLGLIPYPDIVTRLHELSITTATGIPFVMESINTLRITHSHPQNLVPDILPILTSNVTCLKLDFNTYVKPDTVSWIQTSLGEWRNVTDLTILTLSNTLVTSLMKIAMKELVNLQVMDAKTYRIASVRNLPICFKLTRLTTNVLLNLSSIKVFMNRFPSLTALEAPLPQPLLEQLTTMIVEHEYPLILTSK